MCQLYTDNFIKLKDYFVYIAASSEWPHINLEDTQRLCKNLNLMDRTIDAAKVKWLFFQANVEL